MLKILEALKKLKAIEDLVSMKYQQILTPSNYLDQIQKKIKKLYMINILY